MAASSKEISITYYNLGIRKNTSYNVLQRIESETSSRLLDSVDSRVVISFGVNDTVIESGRTRVSENDSIANFEKIINFIKPKYKVIMVGPPPINDDEHNLRIKILNEALKAKAKFLAVPFIELFSKLEGDEEYKKEITDNDGSHPGSGGYEKLAYIVGSSESWWF